MRFRQLMVACLYMVQFIRKYQRRSMHSFVETIQYICMLSYISSVRLKRLLWVVSSIFCPRAQCQPVHCFLMAPSIGTDPRSDIRRPSNRPVSPFGSARGRYHPAIPSHQRGEGAPCGVTRRWHRGSDRRRPTARRGLLEGCREARHSLSLQLPHRLPVHNTRAGGGDWWCCRRYKFNLEPNQWKIIGVIYLLLYTQSIVFTSFCEYNGIICGTSRECEMLIHHEA